MTQIAPEILPVLYGADLAQIDFLLTPDGRPTISLANANARLGLRRDHLYKLVMRNLEQVDGDVFAARVTRAVTAPVTGAAGAPKTQVISLMPCTSESRGSRPPDYRNWIIVVAWGAFMWAIGRISVARMKDPAHRTKILAFTKWVRGVMDALATGKLLPQFRIPLSAHMSLRHRGQKGEHVRQLAADAHRSPAQIWRRIRAAKLQAGIPLRNPRSDKGLPRPSHRCT